MFLATLTLAAAAYDIYYNVLPSVFGRAVTETVPEPQPVAKNPQPKPVKTAPRPQGEKSKVNNIVPEPKQGEKKQPESTTIVCTVTKSKSEGKKVKSTGIPPESTRHGEKPKSTTTVPRPGPEGKKPKAIHPVTESQGQGEIPESDPMAPVPERAGKKVKSKAKHRTGGPALARHIPWPEVVPVTLIQVSAIDSDQVPAADQLDKVPLGSSSDSMYPGYSPGDIEYGKASEEYGKYAVDAKMTGIDSKPSEEHGKYTADTKKNGVDTKPSEEYGKYTVDAKKKGIDSKPSEQYGKHSADTKKKGIDSKPDIEYGKHTVNAKKKGIDSKPEGSEYKVGQSKSHSQLTLARMQALKDFQDRPKSSPAKDTNGASSEAKKTGHKGKGQGSAKASSKDANPVFFTDTNPTPVNLPSSSKKQKPTAEKKDGK
ncbi:MAG: hypothetical protein Q9203_007648, partial [Teloschistes exilis]